MIGELWVGLSPHEVNARMIAMKRMNLFIIHFLTITDNIASSFDSNLA
jgi:hypothetical protein